jgi:dolichol-phosphate mannosyltransferase
MLSNGMLSSLWYVKATLIGILLSMTSNFLLNKAWTFRDLDFSIFHTLRQYGLFAAISSFGAAIQLGLVYMLVESGTFKYEFALITAVAIASISNFILNKKLTFKEKIWS